MTGDDVRKQEIKNKRTYGKREKEHRKTRRLIDNNEIE